MSSIVRFDRICELWMREYSIDKRSACTRRLRMRLTGWFGALASAVVLCFTVGLADADAAEVCEGTIDFNEVDFSDVSAVSQADIERLGESFASQINCSNREGSVRELASQYVGRGYVGLYDSVIYDQAQVAEVARTYDVEVPEGFLESFEFVVLIDAESASSETVDVVRFVVIFTTIEAPVVQLSLTALTIEEGGSGTYTIRLSHDPDGTVIVAPSSSNPEVTPSPSELTFNSNNWATPQTVTVEAAEDDGTDADSATISHGVSGNVAGAGTVSVTVTERDPPVIEDPVVQLSSTALTIVEGGSGTYTIRLSHDPDGTVIVTPSSSNPEVTLSPSELTFNSNNWATPQTVTVEAVEDDGTDADGATISHEVSGNLAGAGTVSVTVTERSTTEPEEAERDATDSTLTTVTATTVTNVASNIGSRFSAARGGISISLNERTTELDDLYMDSLWDGNHESRTLGLDDLFRSHGFQVVFGAAEGADAHMASQWTLWGRGDMQFFSSEPDRGAGYDGDLRAGYLGLDMQLGDQWLAGVAVSRTAAEADYSPEGDVAGDDGRLDIALNSVIPYARYTPDSGTELWAILGAGTGGIDNRRPGRPSPAEKSDVTLFMGAAGGRHAIDVGGPLDWALLGDFSTGEVEIDSGTQAIAGLTVGVWRVRAGVEGSVTAELESGATLTSFLEVAGRYDGGDDEQGGAGGVPGTVLLRSRFGLRPRSA